MSFTKKYISPVYLGVIDIGSYKIRISACKFLNKKITILGYTEKRQNTATFVGGECHDISSLCEDIDEAIKKLESENKVILDKVVINFPFGELFAGTKKINYKRSFPHTPIDQTELEEIIKRAEEISLRKLADEIYNTNGIGKDEIELILSRINSFKIDKQAKEVVIGEQGENIKISVLNVFVPVAKHNLIHHIGNIIEKKILRTLPSEFCLTKLFKEKNMIVLSIGATQTSISIKKSGELIGVSKINIGINDLLIKISKSTGEPYNKILSNLDSYEYEEEKQGFLSIWSDAVLIGIKEIMGEEICPNSIAIFGGGGNNTFIKNALEKLSFKTYDIRIVKKLEFIHINIEDSFHQVEPISHEKITEINLDSFALILETNHILSKEKDSISQSLRNVVKNLGYTSQ